MLAGLNAVELPESRAPRLHHRLDDLTAEMDLEKPRVLLAEMRAPNALALGGRSNGILVFDRSLFHLLDADEFETILAHELAHIESHDSLVQTLAYSAVRTVVGLLTLVLLPAILLLTGVARAWAWLRGKPFHWEQSPMGRLRRRLGQIVALVFVLLTIFVRAHSRHREYAADDRAAEVTGKPMALARALRKIQRATETGFGLLSPLYVSGEEENALSRMLSTHPSMDDRIERLVEKAEGEGKGRHRIEVE
ncbi:M48 family metallopeptidase [Halospeciosus flavus]